MPDTITASNCPTVPTPHNGTVGQLCPVTESQWDRGGTEGGKVSLKALALRALGRGGGGTEAREMAPADRQGRGIRGTDCQAEVSHRAPLNAEKPDGAGLPVWDSHGTGVAQGASASCPSAGTGEEAGQPPRAPGLSPNTSPTLPARDRPSGMSEADLAGFRRAALCRPVSWADPTAVPSPGAWCRCCQGARWWCEVVDPKGWRCATRHPPPPHVPGQGPAWRDVRT